jgi:hypothetical protein
MCLPFNFTANIVPSVATMCFAALRAGTDGVCDPHLNNEENAWDGMCLNILTNAIQQDDLQALCSTIAPAVLAGPCAVPPGLSVLLAAYAAAYS